LYSRTLQNTLHLLKMLKRRIRTSFRPTTPPPPAQPSTPLPPETPPPHVASSSPLRASAAPKTRLKKAVRYIRRHPDEAQAQVARDYHIKARSLSNAIQRGAKGLGAHGGQNKGLTIAQEKVVDDFIRKQLDHNFLPLRPVIFSVITNIRARDSKEPLSEVWFS